MAIGILKAGTKGDPTNSKGRDIADTVNALTTASARHSFAATGRRWAFFGDSITNGSSATNFSHSFTRQAVDAVGQMVARLDYIEAGTAGETSGQVLARFVSTLDAYPSVSAVHILCGTNDAAQSITPQSYINNIIAMVFLARQRGMPVVVSTVPPRGSTGTTTQKTLTNAYNFLLRMYQKDYGYELAEVSSALIDTTTGGMLAAYNSGDDVHPNTLGHIKMGQVVADAMIRSSKVTNNQSLIQSVLSSGIITTDPLNVRTSANSNGWYEWPGGTGTAPVYSMVTDTTNTLVSGRWAEMAVNAAAGGVRRLATTGSSGFAAGDIVMICGRLQIEDLASRWEADVAAGTAGASISVVNQSAVGITGAGVFGGKSAGRKDSYGFYNLGYFAVKFTVPAGTTQLIPWVSLTLPTGGNVKLRIGEFALLNLTTLNCNLEDNSTPVTI